jgi:lipoprotein NlpI
LAASGLLRVCGLAALLALAACQHKVQIEAPKDPIVINLNVKIEQEVRVKVEDDVEQLFDTNDNLF